MECPTPSAAEAADPGGAGPCNSSEEQEGREPDGVRFDHERARRLLEAVSGAQPAGREEGESGGSVIAAGRRRDGLPPVPALARAGLCTTSRNSKLALGKSAEPRNSPPCGIFPPSFPIPRGQVPPNSRSCPLGDPQDFPSLTRSRANYHSYLRLIPHLHIASLPSQSPTVLTDRNGFIQFTLFLFIYFATPLKLVVGLLPCDRSELWKVYLNPSFLLSLMTTMSWIAIFLSW